MGVCWSCRGEDALLWNEYEITVRTKESIIYLNSFCCVGDFLGLVCLIP